MYDSEKRELGVRVKSIKRPFKLEFIDQWPILIKSLLFIYFLICFSAIIISNQLFSFEKEKNMFVILSAAGKKLKWIGLKKVLAMITYLTLEFCLCTILVLSIIFILTGISGWDSQIQVLPQFFNMIYNFTIGQMVLYYILIAWISIISIAMIGALLNSITQQTYTSFIISILILISPIFLKNSETIPIIFKKFLFIQPINGINLLTSIDSLFSYNVLEIGRVLTLTAILIFAMVCILICIIFSPIFFVGKFRKSQ